MCAKVMVHPKYHTIGAGSNSCMILCPLCEKPCAEMIAVTAKYNPFAEKAGMKKILESKPNPANEGILTLEEKLRALHMMFGSFR